MTTILLINLTWSNSMFSIVLTFEAGLNICITDINGKYNNEKNIKDIILNTKASLVSLVHYASHILICKRWQKLVSNTDKRMIWLSYTIRLILFVSHWKLKFYRDKIHLSPLHRSVTLFFRWPITVKKSHNYE